MGDDAILRGKHRGVGQLVTRRSERGDGALHHRFGVDRPGIVPGKAGQHRLVLLLAAGDAGAGVLHGEQRLIVLRLRRDAFGQQLLLARRLAAGIIKLGLRRSDVRLALAISRALRGHLRTGIGQRRLVGRDRRGKRGGIDAEQHLAGADVLVLAHLHRDHPAVDRGADHRQAGLEIGVVGGLIAPAGQPEPQPGNHRQHRHADQPDQPHPEP